MALQCVELCPCGHVPDNDAGVRPTRHQEVFCADTETEYRLDEVCVASVFPARCAGVGGPAPDGFVPAAGEDGACVRAEGDAGEGGGRATVDV